VGSIFYIEVFVKIRAVKMGWNSRANSAHHGFGLGWTQIIRVELVVSRVGSPIHR